MLPFSNEVTRAHPTTKLPSLHQFAIAGFIIHTSYLIPLHQVFQITMSFQSNREISPASVIEHKKMNKPWNKFGPEGKQLNKDIIQGVNDGTLDLAAPKYMTLYNKNPEIYGKFSKDCFRNNLKAALKDYSSAIAMGHSAPGEYHACGWRHF